MGPAEAVQLQQVWWGAVRPDADERLQLLADYYRRDVRGAEAIIARAKAKIAAARSP